MTTARSQHTPSTIYPTHTARSAERRPPAATLLAAIAAVGAWAAIASADAVKLGGFWIDNVTVQGIVDGKVLYINSIGTEFSRPIQALEGLKLTPYPQLGLAQESIGAGNDRLAVRNLLEVQRKAREPWVRQWVSYQLVDVYNRLNEPAKAADTFLSLARERADVAYLAKPPLESLARAPEPTKKELSTRLTALLKELGNEPQADPVRKLLDLVASPTPPSPAPARPAVSPYTYAPPRSDAAAPAAGTPPPATPAKARGSERPQPVAAAQGRASNAAVVLADRIDEQDPITQLLEAGEFDKALSAVDKLLSQSDDQMPMRLYQRGVAQFALAQQNGSRDQYMDAGVSFMRVVTYFPKSAYAAPSLIEAGFVSAQIGRRDVAEKLYDKAKPLIDAPTEPRYAARLEQLSQSLAPTKN